MNAPSETSALALDAPAKINLFLHITGRRGDGFHLLESLVAFAEHGDQVSVAPDEALEFRMEGRFAVDLRNTEMPNLVLQAVERLRKKAEIRKGARIVLTKNLPIASGIGGGSADAAATLRLLTRLWQVPASGKILAGIAPGLGADVPVCLVSTPSLITGIGERVTPLPALPPCGVVLVNAGEQVSTPRVFAVRSGSFTPESGWPAAGISDFEELISRLAARRNDLGLAAKSVSPVIGDVLGAIDATQGCRLARLSGSGGTCFGLYQDIEMARQAADAIERAHPAWWVVPTAFRSIAPEIGSKRVC